MVSSNIYTYVENISTNQLNKKITVRGNNTINKTVNHWSKWCNTRKMTKMPFTFYVNQEIIIETNHMNRFHTKSSLIVIGMIGITKEEEVFWSYTLCGSNIQLEISIVITTTLYDPSKMQRSKVWCNIYTRLCLQV